MGHRICGRAHDRRMTRTRSVALTAAVLLPVAACALLGLVRGMVANNNAALVLVLVVVAVAATGYRAAGLVAAVVSAASFDFFLTQPYLQFAITERDDVEAAVLLALIGLAVTEIALWGRRQQARASVRAGYLDGVVSAARLAASGVTPPSDVVDLIGRQIVDVLDLDACRFDASPHADPDRPRLQVDGEHHLARPGRRRRAGGPADARRHRTGGDLRGVDRGRFLLVSTSAVRRPDRERRLVAVALADQAAAALASRTQKQHTGAGDDA